MLTVPKQDFEGIEPKGTPAAPNNPGDQHSGTDKPALPPTTVDPAKVDQLDESTLQALGKTPITQKTITLELNVQIAKVFMWIKNNGMDREDLSKLKAKYTIPEGFNPPDLMSGIQMNTAAKHLKREFWRLKVQEDLCPGLALITAAITMIIEQQKKLQEAVVPELKKVETLLIESGRLIANAIHQETESRKTLLSPAFIPSVRGIVKGSKTDDKLFGGNLVAAAKEHLEMKSIMIQERSTRPVRPVFPGNFRTRPYTGRPPITYPNFQGQRNFPQGQFMPQLQNFNAQPFIQRKSSSRGRKINQPFNPRLVNRAGASMKTFNN